MKPKNRPNDSSFNSRGVFGVFASEISLAIRPSCVLIPVSTTTPTARPVATVVPMYIMFRRSARSVFLSIELRCFVIGSDSPVRADSSTRHWYTSSKRMSAGTLIPSSNLTISPGTKSVVGISDSNPSRSVTELEMLICLSASIACSACPSCQKPKKAFAVRTRKMKMASPG